MKDNGALQLPPSKKTRALLAYLATTGRSHRRERLCSLLWDVTDDPRGALRWSLSRLRPLVNEKDVERLVSDRDSVAFEAKGAQIDLLVLKKKLENGVAALGTDSLRKLAREFRGAFLEGLELPEFHDFQAWCVAERESARRLHSSLLEALSTRLSALPEQALDYAQQWVQVDSLNATARASFIELLGKLGRYEEIEEQKRAATRLFTELGAEVPSVLEEAFRSVKKRPRTSEAPLRERASVPPPPTAKVGELPPIVGRDRWLFSLRKTAQEVILRRRQQVVLLNGEPGVGKTRLLAELIREARARGSHVLEGRAYEAELGRPYGPWTDALRKLAASDSGPEAAQALSLLVPDVSGTPDRQPSRDALFGAVTGLIANQAKAAAGAMLVFDDVQWLDEASVALLHYSLRVTGQLPLFVVLGARDGELSDNAPMDRTLGALRREHRLREIALERLGEAETRDLLATFGEALDTHSVFAESGGNPLFALEIARALFDGQALTAARSVRAVVAERVERLPEDAADVLRWAATLGSVVNVKRLEQLVAMDLDDLSRALEVLERHALLAGEGDGYAFTHEIVKNVVYSELSLPRRRLMHRKVAQTLEQQAKRDEAVAGELAHHAALAGDAAVAARACIAAGQRCLRLFANRQAEALARRGLHYADSLDDEDRVMLSIELMEIQFMARRPDDLTRTGDLLEELTQKAMDYGRLEHARLGFSMISYLRWEEGAWADAKRTTLAAEFVSRSTDDRERVVAMSEAARCLALLEKDLGNAETMLLEASALAERLGVEPIALADAVGLLRLHRGELDEATAPLEKACALAQRDGDRVRQFYSLTHRLMVEVQREDYQQAQSLADDMLRLANKLREGSEVPFAKAMVGFCQYALQQPGGKELLDEGLAELRLVDAKYRLVFALTRTAELDRLRGETERALREAEEALRVSQVLKRPSETALSRITLAWLAHERGDRPGLEAQLTALGQSQTSVSAEVKSKATALKQAVGRLDSN